MARERLVNVLWDTLRSAYCAGSCRFCGQAFAETTSENVFTTREHTSIGLFTALAHSLCAVKAIERGEARVHV